MNPPRGHIRPFSSLADRLFRVSDALLIVGSLATLFSLLRVRTNQPEAYYLLAAVAVIGFYVSAEIGGLYRAWRGDSWLREWQAVWAVWLWTVPALLLMGYAAKISSVYSRELVFTWFITTPMVLGVWRWAVRAYLKRQRVHGHNTRRAAIIGIGETAQRVAEAIRANPESGFHLLGFYDDTNEANGPARAAPQGTVEDLAQLARAGQVDHVYVALPMSQESRIAEIIERFADSTVHLMVAPNFLMYDLLNARWSRLGNLPVLNVYDAPFSRAEQVIKRIEDVLLCLLFLAPALPLMAVIAATLKLTSRGPVIFTQRRYGMDGREIVIWKFRTLTVSEDGDAVAQVRSNDPRVTPVGRWLRRTSLDELPQLINVLEGRLSLVGPRPHAVVHNEYYRSKIRGYMLRHKIKPGLTGLAQVRGFRGETDTLEKMQRRVECDLEYLRTWSPLLDVYIVAMTLWRLIRQPSAY